MIPWLPSPRFPYPPLGSRWRLNTSDGWEQEIEVVAWNAADDRPDVAVDFGLTVVVRVVAVGPSRTLSHIGDIELWPPSIFSDPPMLTRLEDT